MKHNEDVGSMMGKETPLDVPDHVIESFARCLLPVMREYFYSEEGQKEYADWKTENEKRDTEN